MSPSDCLPTLEQHMHVTPDSVRFLTNQFQLIILQIRE